MPLLVALEFTETDYVAVQRDLLRNMRGLWLVRMLLMCAPLLILTFVVLYRPHMLTPAGLAPLIALAVYLLVAMPLGFRAIAKRTFRLTPSAHGPHTFAVSPEGIHIVGPLHQHILAWCAFTKIVAAERNLLFFVSQRSAHFLPTRALTPNELALAYSIIRQNAPSEVALGLPPSPAV